MTHHFVIAWAVIVIASLLAVAGAYAKGRYDERRKQHNKYRQGKGFISLLRKDGKI